MSANEQQEETTLVEFAIAWLGERLPASWEVVRGQRDDPAAIEAGIDRARVDAFIDLRAPNGTYTTIAVEVRRAMQPKDVEQLLSGVARSLRALAGFVPLLVIAPWLSERTRDLLARDGFNYLDATGNALVRLDNPAVFVQSEGAQRNPEPSQRAVASIRGTKAARLVRLLADVRPPYAVRDLAGAAELTPGYVSRLLDALDRQALVTRGRRGVVEDVDVAALLRTWADGYDLFRRQSTSRYLAPAGAKATLARLSEAAGAVVVTGSFAAVRLAPVAAPALLAAYCSNPDAVAETLGLLPADSGADIALLRPTDEVALARTQTVDGVRYAAPSQVCVDCLAGNGRMPAEGEALLAWMLADEARWRTPALEDLAAA